MSSIKTAIRVRPFLASQLAQNYKNTRLTINPEKRQITTKDDNNHKKSFQFDYLISQQDNQEAAYYKTHVDELLNKTLQGYHSTIFAYGQTGSGKTYTMEGDCASNSEVSNLDGIIPRLAGKLFQQINKMKGICTFTVSISFLQIYSQKIYDLLNPSSLNNRSLQLTGTQTDGLRLRWTKDQQFSVQNLFISQCKNQAELIKYYQAGLKNRISAAHKLNLQSSRSHSILSIKIQSFDNSDPTHVRSSRFELVDLAGSERLSLTGTQGKQAKESIQINKSLFTLRQVINVLSENANPSKKKEEKLYVPYRDSKLTSILKQSIGGNSFCLMIACINPNDSFFQQNISTLTYATKASFITNRPILNADPKLNIIKQLKIQIKQLTSELEKANKHIQFISTLNEQKMKKTSQQKPKATLQKGISEFQDSMPTPSFHKNISEKSGKGWDSSISERLIQSINMVRQLLKSNKQLRQKLQNANRCVEESNLQITQLIKQVEELKQRNGQSSMGILNKHLVNNNKRLSFKISNTKPVEETRIEKINHKMTINPGVSLQMNRAYMNQKGLDSAPTNFNKRLTSTSQERRISISRNNNSSQEDRYAITAKISKRGWLGKEGQANRFLSFYDDVKN